MAYLKPGLLMMVFVLLACVSSIIESLADEACNKKCYDEREKTINDNLQDSDANFAAWMGYIDCMEQVCGNKPEDYITPV